MSDPKYSPKIERTQAMVWQILTKVSLYIRAPGSSEREKFGHIAGRRLILPDESNSAGYMFTYDEWIMLSRLAGHYHLRIEQHDFHHAIMQISGAISKTRRSRRKFSQFIEMDSKSKPRRQKDQQRIDELEQQLIHAKKETNQLNRKLATLPGYNRRSLR